MYLFDYQRSKKDIGFFFGLLLTLSIGALTYFKNYQTPASFFWDENYHIASAQKYLNGVFYMEPHPPLGKLIIAAGEWLIAPNKLNSQFVDVDYAKELPVGFSFAGYRFFPTLLAWLAAGVFYLILYEITASATKSFLLATPYLFDNALIVHNRGAMLEGPQLFFLMLAVLCLVRCSKGCCGVSNAIAFGVSFGLMLATKINALILLALPCVVLITCRQWKRIVPYMATVLVVATSICGVIWSIHIYLAKHIEPTLPEDGYYQASSEYKAALSNNQPIPWLTALIDHVKYSKHYVGGVPTLDICKEDENGSFPAFWPFGGSAINYRWERVNQTHVRYLYLQSNPVGWLVTLMSVLLITAICITSSVSANHIQIAPMAVTLVLGYWGYMFVVLSVNRVLYLYHYFIPLSFGYLLLPYAIDHIQRIGSYKITLAAKKYFSIFLAISIMGSYLYFKPLTYYEPIDNDGIERRSWLSIWRLHCVDCERPAFMGKP